VHKDVKAEQSNIKRTRIKNYIQDRAKHDKSHMLRNSSVFREFGVLTKTVFFLKC